MDVSVLDGDVNRNWYLTDGRGERHLLTLFHDTVTGVRAAMLDYKVGSPLLCAYSFYYHYNFVGNVLYLSLLACNTRRTETYL